MARSSEAARLGAEQLYSATGPSLYERDIYSWALEQARLIREGRFAEIDVENVAEEIESLGRSERSSVRSFLVLIIQHMLKWDYQPEKRTRSWLFRSTLIASTSTSSSTTTLA